MRRTARALSLAAAAGAALAALAPAASAGTVLDDRASWGTTSPSPCPRPEGHAWEPDAALGPAGPEAVVPRSTAPDEPEAEFDAGPDAEFGTDADAGSGFGAEIPAPQESGSAGSEAVVPRSTVLDESEAELDAGPDAEFGTDADAEADAGPDAEFDAGLDAEFGTDADAGPGFGAEIPAPQESGPADPEALRPRPTASKPPEPKPTGSEGTPCPTAPAHQGVHAGAGGAFTDSVPALAAGGLLIAGAFGAAAHRVYRARTTRADG
ncbi:hypothetical protein ACIA6T_17325 [Streptomyces sp. NPDC051740]|uniref:hypothetical protein n=1 Tax=Streptomyces sp. NPDC051740 TaxID=3365673 RepID=UPI0037A8521A